MRRGSVLLALVVVVMMAMGRTATAQTTYSQVLQQIFQPHCLGCHSSTLAGDARNGAPASVNFDTFANATSNNNEVNANILVQAGSMPRRPPPDNTPIPLPQDLKNLMQAWANGGFLPNTAPTANAGPDQNVNEGVLVTLNGSNSSDPDGTIGTFAWTQTAGPSVTLSNAAAQQPTFTAPSAGPVGLTLQFQLQVTDNISSGVLAPADRQSDTDTVTINIANLSFTLTVSKAGTGSGTVTSSPAGINCGSTCSAPFDLGTSVTLTATADSGSTFTTAGVGRGVVARARAR